MPYDLEVQARIMAVQENWPDVVEKKMFGGVCSLMRGNMVSGVYKDNLILRIGVEAADLALKQPHCHPFDITGRPMKGWVMVDPEGFAEDATLEAWLAKARTFVQTLPPKQELC